MVKKIKKLYSIQVPDPAVEPLIKKLAEVDMRTIGNEVVFLIRKEAAERFPEDYKKFIEKG